MTRCALRQSLFSIMVLSLALLATRAVAAPRINAVSLRGLQAGGVTTLVIDGSELAPDTRVLLSAPVARAAIKDGATPARLEWEVALDGQTPGGIYLLRVASASGISDPVAIAIDNLPQIPFAPQIAATPVAMTGALGGSTVLTTTFAGKQGQRVFVEVESRRLGSNLNPVVHIYDSRRTQLAWSQGLASIAGDARCQATLPADGQYTVELHDALYRGSDPGMFRLKIGDFNYADLAYPLAVEQGSKATLGFALSNLPDAKAEATWPKGELPLRYQPAPWPSGTLGSGSRAVVLLSDHAEVVEAANEGKLQEIPAAPVGINGRLSAAAEQDRYRLAVTPGESLRFDVLARRAGSPLDGVLSIQNEQGAVLGSNDDRPGNSDPGLDFKVPDGVTAVVVVLRDLSARGGPDFVYRINVVRAGSPDFSLTLESPTYSIPKDGVALARVKVDRAGYNGPIKLGFANLPTSVSLTLDEIPAGANEALVTLSAPGLNPAQSLATVVGHSTEENTRLARPALPPQTVVTKQQPWLRDEVGMAVTPAGPLNLVWDLFTADTRLALATGLPIKLRVKRAEGATGAVRLSLITTQPKLRKRVKVNNVDTQVDDVERTLRFESAPTIAADKNEVDAKLIVPADLAAIAYDLAISAELLAADNKTVVAAAVTPARRMTVGVPISLELATKGPIEARAGLGETGKLTGKIQRTNGFAQAVAIKLAGLPKGVPTPQIVIAGDKSDFELPVAFPYATPAGDLANVKLTATSIVDPKNPKLVLKTNEVPVAIKVVPGEKPPMEKLLVVFEDQEEFVANLTEGGGQATLATDDKYSGAASVKVTPDQRFNPALPGLGVKIREKPAAGEFRYLRFAWKKQGGQAICLQLNHDGQWGPVAGSAAKFRYHAGPAGEVFGASVGVDAALPSGFTVVTRDLFADFGEFTLNGIALSPVDGEFALFDHIYLAAAEADFEAVKP